MLCHTLMNFRFYDFLSIIVSIQMMQLVEAQNQLRNAIMEKEDHIEELLREIETFRGLQVENAQLKVLIEPG